MMDDDGGDGQEIRWDELIPAWEVEATTTAPTWVSLAEAEVQAGVSRSALRAWYRSGQVPSRLIDSRYGPQRVVPLDAVVDRAQQSPRLQRQAARSLTLEAEVVLLRQRLDDLERRVTSLEADPG